MFIMGELAQGIDWKKKDAAQKKTSQDFAWDELADVSVLVTGSDQKQVLPLPRYAASAEAMAARRGDIHKRGSKRVG